MDTINPHPEGEMDTYELKSKSLLQQSRDAAAPAPPYLKSRITAELDTISRLKKKNVFLKRLSVATSLSSVLLLTYIFVTPTGKTTKALSFMIAAQKPVVIRLEPKYFAPKTTLVRVDLPKGVTFYSKKHLQIETQSWLTLPVSEILTDASDLKFVVQSGEAGLKEIKVQYLDAEEKKLGQKTITIDFTPLKES